MSFCGNFLTLCYTQFSLPSSAVKSCTRGSSLVLFIGKLIYSFIASYLMRQWIFVMQVQQELCHNIFSFQHWFWCFSAFEQLVNVTAFLSSKSNQINVIKYFDSHTYFDDSTSTIFKQKIIVGITFCESTVLLSPKKQE